MPRTTRAELEAKKAVPGKKKVVKKPVKKAAVKKPVKKTATKTAAKSTGSRAVPNKKKSGAKKTVCATKTKAEKEAEEKKRLEDEAEEEEQQRIHEEHTRQVNERLKKEREAIEAAALKKKQQLETNEKGERVVPLTSMSRAIELCIEDGKTPIIVDPSGRADTFFAYQHCQLVDAKAVFLKHGVQKSMSMDDTMEDLRKKVVNSIKNGMYLYICMRNGATDFSNQYHGDDTWPIVKILSGWKPKTQEEVKHLLKDSDLDHNGHFLPKEGYQPIITTQFEPEDYREFLEGSIPMDNLGPIIILPDK